MKTWADYGIDLRGRSGVEVQTTCPQCSSQRKKKRAACLSVNTDKGVWLCHHCGWSGTLGGEQVRPNFRHWAKPTYRKPEPIRVEGLHERHLAWFAERGITSDVLRRNRIVTATHWMPQREEQVNCIAFPYSRAGEMVNAKYRDIEKNFCLEAGAEPIFFGEDDIAETTIIVEGECDKLACEVAGFVNVVSVPHGAPTPEARDYSSKFDFIANCEKAAGVKTWIMAVDTDAPGRALEAELVRRLGRSICKRARWPADCKDANDVLVKHGKVALAEALACPEDLPIEGVFTPMGESGNVMQLYRTGLERGVSTGWSTLDENFTVRPGEMTVLTGIPNSGKSNVADSLAVNMCRLHGWRVAVCSPENQPVADYVARLTEKWTRKPFSPGPTDRMNEDEVTDALLDLEEHVSVILPSEDMTISGVLERAEQLVKRRGIKLLILDPWNEFEHKHARDQTKTDYICETLTMIRAWGRRHGVHVLIVVHPTKLERQKDGNYPVPTLYDCEGSAHWRNKADNGLVVWRDFHATHNEIEIHVVKIRFRQIGKLGVVTLRYEKPTATYREAA